MGCVNDQSEGLYPEYRKIEWQGKKRIHIEAFPMTCTTEEKLVQEQGIEHILTAKEGSHSPTKPPLMNDTGTEPRSSMAKAKAG